MLNVKVLGQNIYVIHMIQILEKTYKLKFIPTSEYNNPKSKYHKESLKTANRVCNGSKKDGQTYYYGYLVEIKASFKKCMSLTKKTFSETGTVNNVSTIFSLSQHKKSLKQNYL